MSEEVIEKALAPTSLDLLEDIVVPEPVSWWPLAPAWWVLIAIVVLGSACWGWLAYRRGKSNAYRRAALRELDELGDGVAGVPALMKRVALAMWPRSEIAGLSGERWIAFLRDTSPDGFDEESAEALLEAGYRGGELDAGKRSSLTRSAKRWIATHRRPNP